MTNLWPEDIALKRIERRAPVVILREQASILDQKTGNLLKGEVVQHKIDTHFGEAFAYSFNIVAPPLDNYSCYLFYIAHNVKFYPLMIRPEHEIMNEIAPNLVQQNMEYIKANSEDEFLEILKKIFSAQKTRQVIESLLSMLNFEPGIPS